jgi:arsenate reductase-like glutaredoxin family protein
MISLATNHRQIVLIYNSNQKSHREIFAYAKAAGKEMLALDVSKDIIGGTVWTEIADVLQVNVRDLLHTDHSSYENKYGKGHQIDDTGAIKTLQKDPEILLYPIAIEGEKGIEVKLYNEMLKLFDVDTAAIKIP